MANLFKNQPQGQPLSQRAALEGKYNLSRNQLLLVVVFSAINLLLTLFQADMYFLFSSFVPLLVVVLGMELCGKFPVEYYDPEFYGDYEEIEFLGDGVFFSTVAIAVVIIALYFICWLMSKNGKAGWIITALVLFALDTVVMFLWNGIDLGSILDILFHAWVIYHLVSGIIAWSKLKKLPPESDEPIQGEFAFANQAPAEGEATVEAPEQDCTSCDENNADKAE